MFRIFLFAVCFICIIEASIYTNKIYKWNKDFENYDTVGKNLIDHKYKTIFKKYNPTQCAYECLKDSKCKSFSHNKTMKSCNFHTATHEEYPASYVDDIQMEYHTRIAFSIDVEALGPCGVDPCNLHGKCLETKTAEDDLVAICLCDPGWTGTECETEKPLPQWGPWKTWEICSVTCDEGWQRRTRNCEDAVTQQSLPNHKCFGPLVDTEFRGCSMTACPRWNEWGTWGECSTRTSCGKGIKTRNRTCGNGGVPGVDRYCLGSTTSTTPCYDMSCKSGIRIKGGSQNGEGRVELYNDHKKEWGLICSDQWNLEMADMVCKQVGLPAAHTAITDGRFGNGNDLYGISSISCNGNERTVQMCERNEWSLSSTTCPSNKAAGIQCQVNGAWSLWSEWGECSVTCEDGIRTRTRQCNHPPALHGGRPCNGEDQQTKPCTLPQCPSNGTWFEWSAWTPCDASCGYGMQGRNRNCDMSTATDPCPGDSEETRSCYSGSCAVDGVWKDWSHWSACSMSCGNGTHYRTRECDGPYHGGSECEAEDKQTRWCKDKECPIDGVWKIWGDWGECSHTCGGGSQSRSRTCDGPYYEGAECPGSTEDVGSCNTFSCPIDGNWKPWQEWQQCNVTCGGGTQIRERECQLPKFGGATCTGSSVEPRECNTHNCPIDGVWKDWSDWETCSLTCGNGTQVRTRTCDGPFHGGKECDPPGSESQACNTHPCPVNGVEGEWGMWGSCSTTCGDGVHVRQRVCIGPYHGGQDCVGPIEELGPCNDRPCPVAANWLPWGEWGACDVSCGAGTQWRERACKEAQHGGDSCFGDSQSSRYCNEVKCPIHGNWAEWGTWAECGVTCGVGQQIRYRNCTGPYFGGDDCVGSESDTQSCNAKPCPVDGIFNEWLEWSECDRTCGGGVSVRKRTCFGPFHKGLDCQGDFTEAKPCNRFNCPIDGVLEPWTAWSECSLSCGGGISERERACIGPEFNGKDCTGPLVETKPCNEQNCPIDGIWKEWSTWDECSLTCGGGTQNRRRECIEPQFGGAACPGDALESRDCNTENCPIDAIVNQWMDWRTCSLTCGGGVQFRFRNCTVAQYGGKDCAAHLQESSSCSMQNCPVDGEYSNWSSWSICSISCGGGLQLRSRTCTEPKHGGSACNGSLVEEQACKTQLCPIDGVWLDWSDWSNCSTTCGGGLSIRSRECQEPQYGGQPCEGIDKESKSCNENTCPIPGDWFEWTDWSPCTVSCNGGTHARSRICDMTSYGDLTAPCEGDPEEITACHTFPCTPLAPTCSAWGELGLEENTMADVDPDGEGGELDPVRVYCDMLSEDGIGVTVIGHDNEERQQVVGYEGAGEFKMPILYNVSLDHAIAIADASTNCKQYLKWECKAALIHNPNGNGVITTGWVNRTGGIADYFSGGVPGSESCACGMDNTCADPGLLCNCDMNDAIWREDSGYITFKNDLPVTEFLAGDTGDGDNESGEVTLGPLLCFGEAPPIGPTDE